MPTLTTLVNFNGGDGQSPYARLFADTAGDLFATTENGGVNADGTVFELVNNISGYTLMMLASFSGVNRAQPESDLVTDAARGLSAQGLWRGR